MLIKLSVKTQKCTESVFCYFCSIHENDQKYTLKISLLPKWPKLQIYTGNLAGNPKASTQAISYSHLCILVNGKHMHHEVLRLYPSTLNSAGPVFAQNNYSKMTRKVWAYCVILRNSTSQLYYDVIYLFWN